ncbi:zinc finger protein 333-like [Pectinophora gossypiella]|uniref:zinc finger protein 333-like n=1 Tax=Pectinophora gossypiella TaxID=13191 RepID=UPI00214E918B|nr:zinc finger protein 333-like [Pectinophora gossypiella]
MLHNSGPYGPSDTSVNIGQPVNMKQMAPPLNIGHNLNNLSKIAQPPPAMPSGHYNMPDYAPYGHPSLNLGSQLGPFPNYPNHFQSPYIPQNATSVHDTSWQNGMLPMSLHPQASHGLNLANYPYDKRPLNSALSNAYKDDEVPHKNLPINVPQGPKAFQKDERLDNYSMYNINQDRFNNFNQHYDFNLVPQERSYLDNTRRKSLENTVRLIEDILISTSKNKETEEQERKASEEKKQEIPKQTDPPKPVEENIDEEKLYEENLDEGKLDEDNIDEENPPVESSTSDEEIGEIEEEAKVESPKEDTSKSNEINLNKNNENMQGEESPENLTMERNELLSQPEKSESPINDVTNTERVIIKVELEEEPCDAKIHVKVEPMFWADSDYVAPFQRDLNGVTSEDVPHRAVMFGENSIEEATAFVRSGIPTTTSTAYYECPHCSLHFNHPKRFLIHVKWHSFGLTYERRSEIAREREISRNQRREARVVDRMNSKEVTEATTAKKVYPCKDCDKAFCSKGSLKNHRQRFHPTRVRACKLCGATVLGWMALREHLAAHTSIGYRCDHCHKHFKYPHSLAKHRDTHLEKTVSCELCPKKFGTAGLLKMHQKVHERAQRGATFRCSYCAKGFYEAYNLSVHERTHRNERPFLCEICNTSFGTNSSLKRHLKVSHSTSKPHECSTCHRSFVSEAIRDRHEARIHGDPARFPHRCTLCDGKYTKLKDLQKHMNKAHPKSKGRKKKKDSDSE